MDVVRIPFRNYLLAGWMKATGWGPDQNWHERFFRRGSIQATGNIHNYLEISPDARVLDLPAGQEFEMLHFNYADSSHWFEKMNRYTTIEAKQRFERGERYALNRFRLVWQTLKTFGRRYLRQGGYRDGHQGFILSIYYAIYTMLWKVKLWELEQGISERYEQERARLHRELVGHDAQGSG